MHQLMRLLFIGVYYTTVVIMIMHFSAILNRVKQMNTMDKLFFAGVFYLVGILAYIELSAVWKCVGKFEEETSRIRHGKEYDCIISEKASTMGKHIFYMYGVTIFIWLSTFNCSRELQNYHTVSLIMVIIVIFAVGIN